MKLLMRYTSNFKISFDNIRNSIETSNLETFNQYKGEILDNINWFFERTTTDNWTNNDYFWTLEDVKNNIESYNYEEQPKCVESKILKILEIEESLISIFYMMG